MVRAIIEGRKTQTRRVISDDWWRCNEPDDFQPGGDRRPGEYCQYGDIGDRLWVREQFSGPHAWSNIPPSGWGWDNTDVPIWYWADGNPPNGDWTRPKPSIHMPRRFSRITLEITDVRVQRLQEISEVDSTAEGCSADPFPGHWWQGYRDFGDGVLHHQQAVGETPPAWMIEPKPMSDVRHLDRSAKDQFQCLWESINAKRAPWESNPFVWAISFKPIKEPQ